MQEINNSDTHKRCSKCKAVKLRSEFYRRLSTSDALRPYCKDCDKKNKKQRRDNNKEKVKIADHRAYKKYYEKNKEKILAGNKKWRDKNKDRINVGQQNRYRERIKTQLSLSLINTLRSKQDEK